LLALTDSGTTGLVGKVHDHTSGEAVPDRIPETEKLLRFESMYDSGCAKGAGLFGRGKMIFNAASKSRCIYYESRTIDGKYRLGRRRFEGRNHKLLPRVLEGSAAESQLSILSEGALTPLTSSGTRIIIEEPIDEVAEAIDSGAMLAAIEETWWEIIQKFKARMTIVKADGTSQEATIPKEYNGLLVKDADGWKVYHKENEEVAIGDEGFDVKRIHLLVAPKGSVMRQDLCGVSIYRCGMKIGPIDHVVGIPEEIEDRFFGYVQLDDDLENEIKEIEDITHYGFGFTRQKVYQAVKKFVQRHLDMFLDQAGFRSKTKDPEETSKRISEEAISELSKILADLDVPSFGPGAKKKDEISLSIEGLEFPGGSNCVASGSELSGFYYSVQNLADKDVSVNMEVDTHESGKGVLEQLLTSTAVSLKPREKVETNELAVHFAPPLYPTPAKIGCTARVLDRSGKELARSTFYVYVDMKVPPPSEFAKMQLVSVDWPRKDSRRVNIDESIRNLKYEITNLSPVVMKAVVKTKTLDSVERVPIVSLADQSIELGPFEMKTICIDEIKTDKTQYEEYKKHKILIRLHLTALEKNALWERATRLAESNIPFYLEKDPGRGFFEDSVPIEGAQGDPRSEATPIGPGLWQLRYNTKHPAFKSVREDEEKLKYYLFEEYAKQTVYVLLNVNQSAAVLKLSGLGASTQVEDMTSDQLLEKLAYRAIDRIVAEYWERRQP
jgi:hypothetical protein